MININSADSIIVPIDKYTNTVSSEEAKSLTLVWWLKLRIQMRLSKWDALSKQIFVSMKYNKGATLYQCLSSSVNVISFAYTKRYTYLNKHYAIMYNVFSEIYLLSVTPVNKHRCKWDYYTYYISSFPLLKNTIMRYDILWGVKNNHLDKLFDIMQYYI